MKNFFALLRMTLVRKLTPLKVIGFAFRKDKGTFISGSKENNSCVRGCELDGREIGNATLSWVALIVSSLIFLVQLYLIMKELK